MDKKKVSVLIAFVCQPYLAAIQKKLFDRVWGEEVDEVLINVNGKGDYLRKIIIDMWKKEPKVKFIDEQNWEQRQGPAFNNLYPHATGNVIMFLDSDNFIYKKGVVRYFTDLIYGKVHTSIGSFGYHGYPAKVAERIMAKNSTVRLNPFMAFFDKSIIDKIKDLDFGAFNFAKGEAIPCIGNSDVKGWLDIFGIFCVKYFDLSRNIYKIPGDKDDEWIHVSGLSSVWRRNFRSLEEVNEFRTGKYEKISNHYLIWTYLCYEYTKDMLPKEFNDKFLAMLDFNAKASGSSLEKVAMLSREIKERRKEIFK